MLEKNGVGPLAAEIEEMIGDYDNALATPPSTIIYLLYRRYYGMDGRMSRICDVIRKEKENIEITPKIKN